MPCRRKWLIQLLNKRFYLFVLLTIIFTYGCNRDVNRRLEYSKTTLNTMLKSATHPFWVAMYSRMAAELEAYAQQSTKREPRLLSTGIVQIDDRYVFSVYWAAESPSDVDGYFLIGISNDVLHMLEIPDAYHEINKRDMRKGVIGYSVYKWTETDIPVPMSVLKSNIMVRLRGDPEFKCSGMDILKWE